MVLHNTLVEKYSRPTPRYTSYPTAPHFHERVTKSHYRQWLMSLSPRDTVSLYVHIPFCDRLCWFCGCATKQTNRYRPVERYLAALKCEIAAVGNLMQDETPVTSLHFGGGSPSLLEPADIFDLNQTLRQHFNIASDAQISVEMDPNDLTDDKYDAYADIGVTRVSLGVQDFDQRVQQAINREQSFEQTSAVVKAMRNRGVESVNLDMLYGLPHQTIQTIELTARQVVSLQPDRIALFGYAHVPWMKKHQRMIDEDKLPDAQMRFQQARHAAEYFRDNGYRRIGLDHFAKAADKIAVADHDGTLHRNFQGYTEDGATALIGLGASSIGKLPQGYVQNSVATGDYQRRVASGLATVRGFELSEEDQMRGWLIERLMCDFEFASGQLSERFGQRSENLLSEARALIASDTDGLLEEADGTFRLTETGRPFVRSIAARFDPYFQRGLARHSVSV